MPDRFHATNSMGTQNLATRLDELALLGECGGVRHARAIAVCLLGVSPYPVSANNSRRSGVRSNDRSRYQLRPTLARPFSPLVCGRAAHKIGRGMSLRPEGTVTVGDTRHPGISASRFLANSELPRLTAPHSILPGCARHLSGPQLHRASGAATSYPLPIGPVTCRPGFVVELDILRGGGCRNHLSSSFALIALAPRQS